MSTMSTWLNYSSSGYKSDYDYNLKVVVVGDVGVGKTTFLNTFIEGTFSRKWKDGCCGCREKVLQHNNKKVRLQIWDTAGQERYRSLTSSYYRGAYGCVIMFDVTNKSSFDSVTRWQRDIKYYCQNEDIGIILVGSKCHENDREVDRERAEDLARWANMTYMEVSSETDHDSVVAVFNNVIDMVAEKATTRQITSDSHNRTLPVSLKKTRWRSCCC